MKEKMKSIGLNVFSIFVVFSLAVGCESATKFSESELKAIEVAKDYIKTNVPSKINVLSDEAVVVDLGDSWVVFFRPFGRIVTGGSPEVQIEKSDYHIIEVRAGA